jgi:hypothetical protein
MCQFLLRSAKESAANFFTKNANHDQSDEALTMSKQQDSHSGLCKGVVE